MNKYKNKKIEVDGIGFDSLLEAKYYKYLLEQQKKGHVGSFITQPRYLLQESFKKNGKHYRKIEYVADFEVTLSDGTVEFIDIKGRVLPVFAIKQKLFERLYPDMTLKLLNYSAKWGGWIELQELERLRKKNKKVKKCQKKKIN